MAGRGTKNWHIIFNRKEKKMKRKDEQDSSASQVSETAKLREGLPIDNQQQKRDSTPDHSRDIKEADAPASSGGLKDEETLGIP